MKMDCKMTGRDYIFAVVVERNADTTFSFVYKDLFQNIQHLYVIQGVHATQGCIANITYSTAARTICRQMLTIPSLRQLAELVSHRQRLLQDLVKSKLNLDSYFHSMYWNR